MKITWLGHSAFRLEFKDAVVLIDPFLTGNASFNGSVEEASRGAMHVVLTHGHDDHVGDAVEICKRTGAQLIAGYELCAWLQEQGVENINPGNTGGTVPGDGFTVTFTRAYHSSGTTRDGRSIYLGNPLGIVLRAEGEPTVYHMGDTDIFSDMALIQELYRPEVGLVPIGDRFTMNPHTAAIACKRFFDFKTIIPCHYGTFPILEPNARKFVDEMGNLPVVVPQVGETLEISA